MDIDLTKIKGKKKKAWWYNPSNGELRYIGEFANKVVKFTPTAQNASTSDCVLIVTDASQTYVSPAWASLHDAQSSKIR